MPSLPSERYFAVKVRKKLYVTAGRPSQTAIGRKTRKIEDEGRRRIKGSAATTPHTKGFGRMEMGTRHGIRRKAMASPEGSPIQRDESFLSILDGSRESVR